MDGIDLVYERLRKGLVIPACPLALTRARGLDARRQRALVRYYAAAGAGGLAVGVHTTQFGIRDPKVGLLRPVLDLVRETLDSMAPSASRGFIRIAGVCGSTSQAVAEAEQARALGYHAGLLSLGALPSATDRELMEHCRAVGRVIPLFGFYLQPAAGGRRLSSAFWRRFAELESVVAIKIAPFNRYQTLDVVRAVAEAGRDDIALYTGNDDQIIFDLLTPFRFRVRGRLIERRVVGGLLGQFAVWTHRAVELHRECRRVSSRGGPIPIELVRRAVELTEANGAIFDAANGFAGCIPGIHEVLRRQGLLSGRWCLDPAERLSPGQQAAIRRVCDAYPGLTDDAFVREHLDDWLR